MHLVRNFEPWNSAETAKAMKTLETELNASYTMR